MKEAQSLVSDRGSLFRELEQLIVAHQSSDKKLAVLLISINQFRQFNINYGYQLGDHLLEEITQKLLETGREQDYIARVGNSEFIVVLPEIYTEGHTVLAALKFLNGFDEPLDIGVRKIRVTCNVGIAIYPDHAANVGELIQKAERALLSARNGAQPYAIYPAKTNQNEADFLDIEAELQGAIERDEFELFFQPQVYIETGQVFGVEALIRWKHGDSGYIRPDIFIPVAEQTGQIYDITWWTVNAALRLMQEWPTTEIPIKVAVNISTKMFKEHDFVDSVKNSLSIWGSDHERLTLEITESALMDDVSSSFVLLNELSALGLNISIDDFGTGHSSMAYFKNIPADELKIDQSFVFHMLENPMDQHIVETVIHLAHGFDLKVVAEGIEDKDTLDRLGELGCDIAQGYHLAKPMPQEKFIQWMDDYLANLV
jgi:diguanylate cyclase (GGDEF)-like protein